VTTRTGSVDVACDRANIVSVGRGIGTTVVQPGAGRDQEIGRNAVLDRLKDDGAR